MVSSTEYLRFWERHGYDLQRTTNRNLFCTKLPTVPYRHRRRLPSPFTLFSKKPIPDGSMVTVKAGNEMVPVAQLRHAETVMVDNMAVFNDLRFDSNCGPGRDNFFHLSIKIHSDPPQIAHLPHAIRITSDGQRPPRNSRHRQPQRQPVRKAKRHSEQSNRKTVIVQHRRKVIRSTALGFEDYSSEASRMMSIGPSITVIVPTAATVTLTTTTTTTSITTGVRLL